MSIMYTSTDRVNLRKTPKFGENRIGSLHLAQKVEITGPKQGDRWMPSRATIEGVTVSGFVSKNVLRGALSKPKESLVQACVTEWLRFERGTRQEYEQPFVKHIGEYWKSIGMNLDGLDRDVPWSAAFISYVVRIAGGYSGFKYSASHSRYCNKAIRCKLDAKPHPFWGYKIGSYKPKLGDMVCRWRNNAISYEYAATNQWYQSHCDIVVSIEDRNVFTIGGNVKHSVRHTRYKINNQGYLTGDGNVYAVLRNNR